MPKKFKNIVEKQQYWDSMVTKYGEGVRNRQIYMDLYDKPIPGQVSAILKYDLDSEVDKTMPATLGKLYDDYSVAAEEYNNKLQDWEYRLKQGNIKRREVIDRSKYVEQANNKLDDIRKRWDTHPDNKMEILQPDVTWRQLIANRKDIENKELLFASLMAEGGDRFTEAGKGNTKGEPYNGYESFGLDTAYDRMDDFIKKGYLDENIKNRVRKSPGYTGNERGESINPLDFTDLNDVVSFKNAFLKDSKDSIIRFSNEKNIQLSPKALDYFIIASYNYGPNGAKRLLEEYNKAGILKEDKFMNEDSFQSHRQLHRNIIGRMHAADMLKGEKIMDIVEDNNTIVYKK